MEQLLGRYEHGEQCQAATVKKRSVPAEYADMIPRGVTSLNAGRSPV